MIECYRGVVHPWLCDAGGHLTTRHYAAMFDDGSYHLFLAVGFTAEHLARGVGFADVRTTFHYKAELRGGDLLLIEGCVGKIGDRSLTAHYIMWKLPERTRAAETEAVSVQFDLTARRAISLLPELRAGAERMRGNDLSGL